ncbi:MAG: hypothetical protein ABMB14_29925 [Myxococcota bacterium]
MIVAQWITAAAVAGSWSEPKPYALPVLNVTLIAVNGQTSAVASAGLIGGMRLRYRDQPHWLSNTRASLIGSYGLLSQSLGADLRVGSFLGPSGSLFTYQLGPDVWYDGYGREGASDYWLPWSPGVDLHNELTFHPIREISLVGEATPGWAFAASRQDGGVGPFHELTLSALVVLRTPVIGLTVGYTRQYRSFGTYDGLILSGAL